MRAVGVESPQKFEELRVARVGFVGDPRGVGVALAAEAFGFGVGLREDRVALALGAAGDRLIVGFAFGTKRRGDLLAFGADQVKHRRADLDRMVESTQAHVDDFDAQVVENAARDGSRV